MIRNTVYYIMLILVILSIFFDHLAKDESAALFVLRIAVLLLIAAVEHDRRTQN